MCCPCSIVDRPDDAIVDQVLETRKLPGPFIMAIGSIKYFPLAMGARPGIGFGADTWLIFLLIGFDFPHCQHIVIWLQLAVQIGFIICREWLKVCHYRMLGLHGLCGDGIHGMAPELSSYELYVFT